MGEASETFSSELNTGIIITGAYADKIRRTMFAQLGGFVRESRDCAREVARAVAELNTILYYIIVESLKSGKGDAVRIRINYVYDKARNRVTWDYGSLKIEYYRRVPDEEVEAVTRKAINEKLQEVVNRFRTAEAVERTEVEERPRTLGTAPPVSSLLLLGESIDGGLRFAILDQGGKPTGIASIDYEAGGLFADFVCVVGEAAYRCRFRVAGSIDDYRSDPNKLLVEFSKQTCVLINIHDAFTLMDLKRKSIKG